MTNKGKIAIIGSGLIGSCWATLFVSAGYPTTLFDISETQLSQAKQNIRSHLEKLEKENLLRGSLSASDAFLLVSTTTDMAVALSDAVYAQESTMESVEFKRKIYSEMDAIASEHTVLASSTSTIPASTFTENLKNRSRCVVVHPINPPLFLRLVEIVPAPWTSADTVDKASQIMTSIGQESVRLKKEVLGFAVNRLQYALLAEAWRLVSDDVMSPDDVDKVMSEGLGPRYAFNGPLQTIHLNANGIDDYCSRYASGIRKVLADMGGPPSFNEGHVLEKLRNSLESQMPLENLEAHKAQRSVDLADIARLKNARKH